jgi:hypothetical protein
VVGRIEQQKHAEQHARCSQWSLGGTRLAEPPVAEHRHDVGVAGEHHPATLSAPPAPVERMGSRLASIARLTSESSWGSLRPFHHLARSTGGALAIVGDGFDFGGLTDPTAEGDAKFCGTSI